MDSSLRTVPRKAIVKRLAGPIKESLAGQDVKAALEKQAMDVAEAGTPASFATVLTSDLAKWQEAVKKAHVKVD